MLEIVIAQSEAQVQQVREVSRGYIAWLVELDKSLGIYDPEVYETYGYGSGEAQLPGEYAPPDGCLFLALVDGKPAGCIALRMQSASICEVRMLFVFQEFQGQGIGKALVLALLVQAKEMGCSSVRLETSPIMDSAYRLYLSLGFREIQPYYVIEHSLKDVEIFMEKSLL